MPRRLVTSLLATCVLVLAGCGDGTDDTTAEPPDATSSTSGEDQTAASPTREAAGGKDSTPSPEPEPVPAALDFRATTVEGDTFEGASLTGTPTLLWFWAPWCPTCRSQIPEVQGYAADHAGDLTVLGVGSLDSAEAIAAFAGDVGGVTHLEDAEGALYRKFGIAEQSSFVLIDESGEIVFETGYGGSDELASEVEAVLG